MEEPDFGLRTDVEDFTIRELADMLTSDRSYAVVSDEQDKNIVDWAEYCLKKWIKNNELKKDDK